MSRSVWFVVGAAAGMYGVVRARRVAEAFTPDGLRDRAAGVSLGAQLFAQEVRTGMVEKETELRARLALGTDGPWRLEAGEPGTNTLGEARESGDPPGSGDGR